MPFCHLFFPLQNEQQCESSKCIPLIIIFILDLYHINSLRKPHKYSWCQKLGHITWQLVHKLQWQMRIYKKTVKQCECHINIYTVILQCKEHEFSLRCSYVKSTISLLGKFDLNIARRTKVCQMYDRLREDTKCFTIMISQVSKTWPSGPSVHRVDNAIQQINLRYTYNTLCPLHSNLSTGQCYPLFKNWSQ